MSLHLPHPSHPRKSKTILSPEGITAKFLYTIIKQLDLKNIDWNKVAQQLNITNGHAARMRYSRFKAQIEALYRDSRSKTSASDLKMKRKEVRNKQEKDAYGRRMLDETPSKPQKFEDGTRPGLKLEGLNDNWSRTADEVVNADNHYAASRGPVFSGLYNSNVGIMEREMNPRFKLEPRSYIARGPLLTTAPMPQTPVTASSPYYGSSQSSPMSTYLPSTGGSSVGNAQASDFWRTDRQQYQPGQAYTLSVPGSAHFYGHGHYRRFPSAMPPPTTYNAQYDPAGAPLQYHALQTQQAHSMHTIPAPTPAQAQEQAELSTFMKELEDIDFGEFAAEYGTWNGTNFDPVEGDSSTSSVHAASTTSPIGPPNLADGTNPDTKPSFVDEMQLVDQSNDAMQPEEEQGAVRIKQEEQGLLNTGGTVDSSSSNSSHTISATEAAAEVVATAVTNPAPKMETDMDTDTNTIQIKTEAEAEAGAGTTKTETGTKVDFEIL